jgi:hypothetical protein
MRIRVRRPSHATIVAYLALVVALGGSAYAASKIGTNDIRDGAVTSAKIKNENVKGRDLAKPIVRSVRRTGQVGATTLVRATCKRRESLIGGGGGWDTTGSIQFSGPDTVDVPPATAAGYIVQGQTSVPNTLEARALCLPK